MPPPCGHQAPTPPCSLCARWAADPAYQALWGPGDGVAAAPVPPSAPLVPCAPCGRGTRFRLHAGMRPQDMAKLLDGDTAGWPPDWPHWQVTAEAHRLHLAALLARPHRPDPSWSGRGIVTCAGGWRFLAGVYAMARVVRWLGCDYPIHTYYLGANGEFDPCFPAVTAGLGVEWVDATPLPMRRRGGWELKAHAVSAAPWREVLFLDADCYPALDPRRLFDFPQYRAAGALFWPDDGGAANGAPLEPGQFERFGVPHRHEPDFESGQMVIDKARHAPALAAARWFSDHSDYAYHHLYGDKSTWHLAWRAAGAPYHLCPPVRWHNVAFLQHDPDGRVALVHRCRDKPRMPWAPDRQDYRYCTGQRAGVMLRDDTLPHEWLIHQAVADCHALLRPRLAAWREGTQDEDVWREVVLCNGYSLPPRFESGDAVVDVGAHIGSFAVAALERGAGLLVCLEPEPGSYALLSRNLADDPRALTLQAAAWPEAGSLRLTPGRPGTTAEASAGAHAEGQAVRAVAFGEVLEAAARHGGGRVRLVKLDCEGAEWALLERCRAWGLVEEVVGEYHLHGVTRTPEDCGRLLAAHGFEPVVTPNAHEPTLGHFRGVRRCGT